MFWNQDQIDALKVGDKIRRFYFEDNVNNKLFHVRGRVDGLAVVRWWAHGRWVYEVMTWHSFSEHDIVEKS